MIRMVYDELFQNKQMLGLSPSFSLNNNLQFLDAQVNDCIWHDGA